jgi:hypothetical protein
VHVQVFALRLPDHGTDLLITLNSAAEISGTSAAAEHAGAGPQAAAQRAGVLFSEMLRTLAIRDYGLFGAT